MHYLIGLLVPVLHTRWLIGSGGLGGGVIVVLSLIFLLDISQQSGQVSSNAVLAPPVGLLAATIFYKNGKVDIKAAALLRSAFCWRVFWG